jgi:hypothetical protein
MTDTVLAGLTKRRAELAGEADALRTRLAQIGTDIGHLDAVIRQFDPASDLAGIRPKRPRGEGCAGRGEMSRFVLGVLREAPEPVATADVARRLMAERGMDAQDQRLVGRFTKRVAATLRYQGQRGTVRAAPGPGRSVVWGIAG